MKEATSSISRLSSWSASRGYFRCKCSPPPEATRAVEDGATDSLGPSYARGFQLGERLHSLRIEANADRGGHNESV
jgi:hypothetical protein